MFVLASAAGGGAEQQLMLLLRHLDLERVEPTLCLLNAEGPLLSAVPIWIPTIDLRKERPSDIANVAMRLWHRMRETQPHVVLSKGSYANGLSILAARAQPQFTPVIAGEESVPSLALKAARYPRARRLLMQWAYQHATVVTAPSQGVANEVRSLIGPKPVPVQRVPNMIDTAALRTAARQRPLHRFFSCDEPIIISVGRLVRTKRHSDLLRAFSAVRLTRRCRLLIVGDGPERPNLEALAAELGITSLVSFVGFTPNPGPYIAHATLIASASDFESFGNVFIEAMALETPVVAVAVPYGPLELIDHGSTGLLAAPRSPADLAAKIGRLLDQPDLRLSITKSAALSAQDFDTSRVMPRYHELLQEAESIAQSRRRG